MIKRSKSIRRDRSSSRDKRRRRNSYCAPSSSHHATTKRGEDKEVQTNQTSEKLLARRRSLSSLLSAGGVLRSLHRNSTQQSTPKVFKDDIITMNGNHKKDDNEDDVRSTRGYSSLPRRTRRKLGFYDDQDILDYDDQEIKSESSSSTVFHTPKLNENGTNHIQLLTESPKFNRRKEDKSCQVSPGNGSLARDNLSMNSSTVGHNNSSGNNNCGVVMRDKKADEQKEKRLRVRSHLTMSDGIAYIEDSDWEMSSDPGPDAPTRLFETLNLDSSDPNHKFEIPEEEEPFRFMDDDEDDDETIHADDVSSQADSHQNDADDEKDDVLFLRCLKKLIGSGDQRPPPVDTSSSQFMRGDPLNPLNPQSSNIMLNQFHKRQHDNHNDNQRENREKKKGMTHDNHDDSSESRLQRILSKIEDEEEALITLLTKDDMSDHDTITSDKNEHHRDEKLIKHDQNDHRKSSISSTESSSGGEFSSVSFVLPETSPLRFNQFPIGSSSSPFTPLKSQTDHERSSPATLTSGVHSVTPFDHQSSSSANTYTTNHSSKTTSVLKPNNMSLSLNNTSHHHQLSSPQNLHHHQYASPHLLFPSGKVVTVPHLHSPSTGILRDLRNLHHILMESLEEETDDVNSVNESNNGNDTTDDHSMSISSSASPSNVLSDTDYQKERSQESMISWSKKPFSTTNNTSDLILSPEDNNSTLNQDNQLKKDDDKHHLMLINGNHDDDVEKKEDNQDKKKKDEKELIITNGISTSSLTRALQKLGESFYLPSDKDQGSTDDNLDHDDGSDTDKTTTPESESSFKYDFEDVKKKFEAQPVVAEYAVPNKISNGKPLFNDVKMRNGLKNGHHDVHRAVVVDTRTESSGNSSQGSSDGSLTPKVTPDDSQKGSAVHGSSSSSSVISSSQGSSSHNHSPSGSGGSSSGATPARDRNGNNHDAWLSAVRTSKVQPIIISQSEFKKYSNTRLKNSKANSQKSPPSVSKSYLHANRVGASSSSSSSPTSSSSNSTSPNSKKESKNLFIKVMKGLKNNINLTK